MQDKLMTKLTDNWKDWPIEARMRLLSRLQRIPSPAPPAAVVKQIPKCPMVPTPRQAEFLAMQDDDALYGGAAGGGKSEALLRWLVEGFDVPGYSGIIFRRTYAQLEKSNEGLIEKSFRMYKPMGGEWHGDKKCWKFPSGARIDMGHLPFEHSIRDSQGPSYHRIAFDELSQFTERQYLYLRGRIRRTIGFPLRLGIRAGSNPGDTGHVWVKKRFITPEALRAIAGLKSRDPSPAGTVFHHSIQTSEGPVTVGFCPARLADNPYIDINEYAKSLATLDPVTRERMLNGDWSILENSPIQGSWFRYFNQRGQMLEPLDVDAKPLGQIDERQLRRFATVDTAGTSRDKAEDARGKPPSWSVVIVWDYWPSKDFLFHRHTWRDRVGWNELKVRVPGVCEEWRVRRVLIENAHVGQPLRDEMRLFDVKLVGPMLPGMAEGYRGAKLERAIASGLLNRMEAGKLFLPAEANDWKADHESELTGWSGAPDETTDQIDAASYGANECRKASAPWGGVIKQR